jgi:hypothetical protein
MRVPEVRMEAASIMIARGLMDWIALMAEAPLGTDSTSYPLLLKPAM